jgi:hypothetical protein
MDLSIIIPVQRREDDFKLLNQLREKFKSCEIIIVSDENNEFIKSAKIEVEEQTFQIVKTYGFSI